MLHHNITLIAQPSVQRFLIEHENEDEQMLVLKQKEVEGIPAPIIATQLLGRRKAKTKLPTWYKTKGIIYPPSVNLEQSSSEATALFKSAIVNSVISKKELAADLTGGFGVDTLFLSTLFKSIHYVEPDTALQEIARHNHRQLKASNILHHCSEAEEFINLTPLQFDLVYIDPSRRDEQSRKIFKLRDCIPDITRLQSTLLDKSQFLLLKASPLLDIQQGLREISQVKEVYVVSVNNACKELLFLADKYDAHETQVTAVDLFENGEVRSSFTFTVREERDALVKFGDPDHYLYEPNASILKSGAFKLIAENFRLKKLAPNTHLYTSSTQVADFPGRTFKVEFLDPDAKQLIALLPDRKVNVVSKNYPLTPDQIKIKYRLQDGGKKFLLAFSSSKKKHLALCARITSI